ncbi:hypothetical protein ACB098_09G073900 [Castanea mollissima]
MKFYPLRTGVGYPLPNGYGHPYSQLQVLDFAENGLTGIVPNLASLQGLVRLNFDDNRLGYEKDGDLNFLSFLANCTSLEVLANLSTQLTTLSMSQNMIRGDIPIGIENLVNLNKLGLGYNYLRGILPDALGKLWKLKGLFLHGNKFFGPISSFLGNLTTLTLLYKNENRFEGRIPPSLGNCQSLLILNLSFITSYEFVVRIIFFERLLPHHSIIEFHLLSYLIPHPNISYILWRVKEPKGVIGLSSLSIALVLSHNFLIGTLPFEVGNIKNLAELDLSKNRLSGEIPTTLETCLSLEHLYLEGNSFVGAVLLSLNTLRALEDIDLSRNNFSGNIPEFLSKFLSLKAKCQVKVFFQMQAQFQYFKGGVRELHLPTCFIKNHHSSRKLLTLKLVIPITSLILIVLVLLYFFRTCFIVKKLRERTLTTSSFEDLRLRISYVELLKATNRFSKNNLMGLSSFGSIYKGVLSENGAIVAIKLLNLQQQEASISFINECNALRNIRHRNLLKIISACSSIDHKDNDFKSLIFEFMCNGNVQHHSRRLNFIQRLNIAGDVAFALEYLHHHCQIPIVHCDLKPSNILLDENMVAHVGDFGLVKFLFEAFDNPFKTQTLSIEFHWYRMGGQVSTLGDIFSYGILLLEMFTGKKPINEIFKDALTIHKFTSMALPENVMDIVGPLIFFEEDEEGVDNEKNEDDLEVCAIIKEDHHVNVSSRIKDYLISVFQIVLSCSTTSPNERMPANVVVNEMNALRNTFLKFKKGNRRRTKYAN